MQREDSESWHYVTECPFDSSNRMAKYLIDCPFESSNLDRSKDQPLLAFCPVRMCRILIDGGTVLPPTASSGEEISKE